jgi:hypothetical protein
MIGHVERFNAALRACEPYMEEPLFVESHRLAPFNPRGTDVAVVLDLMIHDVDLVLSLMKRPVSSVSAVGVPVLTPSVDIANARLEFEGGGVANLTASRVSLERMRKIRFFQRSGYISLDLAAGRGEYLRLKPGVRRRWRCSGPRRDRRGASRGRRSGSRTWSNGSSLEGDGAEPLARELERFIAAVRGEAAVPVSGHDGGARWRSHSTSWNGHRDMSLLNIRRERREEHRGRIVRRRCGSCCSGSSWPAADLVSDAVHLSLSRPRIFLSAGEPSGDLHGARVAEALRRRWPDAELFGLGGDRMRAAGVELLAHVDQLAVMGFVEVLRHLPYFIEADEDGEAHAGRATSRPRAAHRLPRLQPAAGAPRAGQGIPVLYYIAPQVWAWHRSRMKQLARNTDRLAVILPFETELFREAGANASRSWASAARSAAASGRTARHSCGSRRRSGAAGARAVPGFARAGGGTAAGCVHRPQRAVRRRACRRCSRCWRTSAVPPATYARWTVSPHADGWALLHHARAALVKSGTSTLQAALSGTPLVVTYRVHPLTFFMAQRLVACRTWAW